MHAVFFSFEAIFHIKLKYGNKSVGKEINKQLTKEFTKDFCCEESGENEISFLTKSTTVQKSLWIFLCLIMYFILLPIRNKTDAFKSFQLIKSTRNRKLHVIS